MKFPLSLVLLAMSAAAFSGCCGSHRAIAEAEAAAPANRTLPPNAPGVNIVYGDAIPVVDPKSPDFSEVVIRGHCSPDTLKNVRIFEKKTAERKVQYRICNGANRPLNFVCSNTPFDETGILLEAWSTLPDTFTLGVGETGFVTVPFGRNNQDPARVNLTIIVTPADTH